MQKNDLRSRKEKQSSEDGMDNMLRNTRRTEMELKKAMNLLTKDVEENKEEAAEHLREEHIETMNKCRNIQD